MKSDSPIHLQFIGQLWVGSGNTPIASGGRIGTVQPVTSFLQLVGNLLREPAERAAYLEDPSGYLPARGFGDFEPADVELSLQLSADSFPPTIAGRIDPTDGLDAVVSVDLDWLSSLSDERALLDTLEFDNTADLDAPGTELLTDATAAESLDLNLSDDDDSAADVQPSTITLDQDWQAGGEDVDGLTTFDLSGPHDDDFDAALDLADTNSGLTESYDDLDPLDESTSPDGDGGSLLD